MHDRLQLMKEFRSLGLQLITEGTQYSGTAQTCPFCREVIYFVVNFLKSVGRQSFTAVKETLNFILESE